MFIKPTTAQPIPNQLPTRGSESTTPPAPQFTVATPGLNRITAPVSSPPRETGGGLPGLAADLIKYALGLSPSPFKGFNPLKGFGE
ncbi:MAG: hypothetical protein IPJ69_12815 [Deltaproteobacteria bacterium]|nr:MAG: hypothetical protein IPJ69_12815 [Deltaproteobacteria bacterium]